MRFAYDTSYADARRLLRFPAGRIAYALLLAALLAAPFVLPKFFIGEGAALFISAIMSLGLMLLMGYTGQVSLGHAAFAAIGAYAHVWLMGQGVPFLLSLAAGGGAGGGGGHRDRAAGDPGVAGCIWRWRRWRFRSSSSRWRGRWKSVTGGYGGIAVPDPVVLRLQPRRAGAVRLCASPCWCW
jgi:branched-chain amino acid transport system permease protein